MQQALVDAAAAGLWVSMLAWLAALWWEAAVGKARRETRGDSRGD